MKLCFYEPSAEKKAGGLDQAIRSLEQFLLGQGHQVVINPESLPSVGTPDLIHFHGLWQPHFLKIARSAMQEGIPYVVSPHGMLEPWAWRHKYWKKLPYYFLFERSLLHKAGAILATSDQEAHNLRRFASGEQIKVVPLGISEPRTPSYSPARKTLGWCPDEFVFLYLSRIHEKKGLELLLQALGSASQDLPDNWRLVVVGDGDNNYVNRCKAVADSNATLKGRVKWMGGIWGDEKWAYFQAADLFCLPSFSENFGLAILESCQVGTPVLASTKTPWGFLKQLGAAILVEPNTQSIKQGLLQLKGRPRWGEQQRKNLCESIHKTYSWDKIGGAYMRLYNHLLNRDLGRPIPYPFRDDND